MCRDAGGARASAPQAKKALFFVQIANKQQLR